jgi:hypothetical protein
MTSRFSRFLNLERTRGERPGPEEPSQLQNGNRFEAMAGPREAPQTGSVPEAHLERFKGEVPLALADPEQKAEHFPRCARCEGENGAFAKECGVCGADLTTPQQREYNERLQQSRQQAMAQAREAAAAFEQERQRQEAEKREDAERYVRLLSQAREQEQPGTWWRGISEHGSIGLWLLSLIPHPGLRWGVLAALLLLPILIWRFSRGTGRLFAVALGVFLLVLILPSWRKS